MSLQIIAASESSFAVWADVRFVVEVFLPDMALPEHCQSEGVLANGTGIFGRIRIFSSFPFDRLQHLSFTIPGFQQRMFFHVLEIASFV